MGALVWSCIILGTALIVTGSPSASLNADEEAAKLFLSVYNVEYSELLNKYVTADWNYSTNLTDENAAISEAAGAQLSEYSDAANANASLFDSTNFSDEVKRQLRFVGSKSLNQSEMKELSTLLNDMGRIYGSYQACRTNGTTGQQECLSLEPELTNILAESRDPSERLWAWQTWHNGVGRQIRPKYIRYVQLKNKMARLNGYSDYGDQWRQKYETKELERIVRDLYSQAEPLYKQLHAYVRRKLYQTYGSAHVNLTGTLPVHLLGDMWGRFWINLNSIAQPYPNKPSVDPTPQMIAQGYTVRTMFEKGDDFYRSMGLKPVPSTFYNLSMLEKPTDRDVTCHATAWDFYDGRDYRIRMCTRITFEDFLTVHHELGHIQYFMQYAHQPVMFKDGANDGFHEAVGELMAMSVATTKHLKAIGLLDVDDDDPEVDMNFLVQQALNTLSTLPFHLVQDTWRWKIFAEENPDYSTWNDEYWRQKSEIVGVHAPDIRDPNLDLDPVAIYHVSGDYDMIRYFMRTVMQYQFAEVLCNASGHQGPLYKCDFYNSTAAGDALARMLQLGCSKPWQDAMEALTGQRNVTITPMLNYFEPLRLWLEKKNAENNETIGWTSESAGSSFSRIVAGFWPLFFFTLLLKEIV